MGSIILAILDNTIICLPIFIVYIKKSYTFINALYLDHVRRWKWNTTCINASYLYHERRWNTI